MSKEESEESEREKAEASKRRGLVKRREKQSVGRFRWVKFRPRPQAGSVCESMVKNAEKTGVAGLGKTLSGLEKVRAFPK